MYNIKTIFTAASLAVLAVAGSASAAPSDNHGDNRDHRPAFHYDDGRHDPYFNRAHQRIVVRERVYDSLRLHHYRGVGQPIFRHGHYVVKSFNRFGRIVFVEVDPYTGAFLGEFRI
jgi:hypothetical protein